MGEMEKVRNVGRFGSTYMSEFVFGARLSWAKQRHNAIMANPPMP